MTIGFLPLTQSASKTNERWRNFNCTLVSHQPLIPQWKLFCLLINGTEEKTTANQFTYIKIRIPAKRPGTSIPRLPFLHWIPWLFYRLTKKSQLFEQQCPQCFLLLATIGLKCNSVKCSPFRNNFQFIFLVIIFSPFRCWYLPHIWTSTWKNQAFSLSILWIMNMSNGICVG